MKILIKNIKEIIQIDETGLEKVASERIKFLPHISDAWLASRS